MSCDVPAERISAYADGELDAASERELERHLATCPDCTASLAQVRALHEALAAPALRHRPSGAEVRRVRAALRAAAGPSRPWAPWRQWIAAAALLAVALAGYLTGQWSARRGGDDALVQELATSHVRSLLAAHLTDVASSDRHTVKPWFNGRLDYPPPVADLADAGFPLRGGRLDVVGGQRVAALVYQSERHVINLFVWPATSPGTTAAAALTLRGYHLEHWQQDGMSFWAVSDLEAGRLHEFALRLRAELAAGSPPRSGGR